MAPSRSHERVVFDGKLVTAAGVSAGIDMALTLAARIAGDAVAQAIQLGIEYDPQPPFDAGSPHKAPAEIVELLRSRSRFGSRSGGARDASADAHAAAQPRQPAGFRRRPPANLRLPMAEHRYDPQEIEPRWQALWARERTWEVSNEPAPTARAERAARGRRTPTCSRCCPTRAASRTSAT